MKPMGGDYETKKRLRENQIKSSPQNAEGDTDSKSDSEFPVNSPIHIGQMTNLVVYIRFADDTEAFGYSASTYESRFNGSTNSVNHYFQTVSYGKAGITSYHFPPHNGNSVVSYQDVYNRSYYQPYSSTNPDGYTSSQRSSREWGLLRRAIMHIESMVPDSINLDKDNNGHVDSVSFIIKGGSGGWGSILWAHRWVLGGTATYIKGKRVWDYCFQPESQASRQILTHELFHVYGAPDLYRYSATNITPVGPWDLMHSGNGHMGAWMKHKYTQGDWLAEIPTVTESGYYTLNSLHDNEVNSCLRINSPVSSEEFYIVEFRSKRHGDIYEATIPGTGLLIYRIYPEVRGNSNGPPDEVYIYRPNGSLVLNGLVQHAHYSDLLGRTSIGGEGDLKAFLRDGVDGQLKINQITDHQDGTITFYVDLTQTPEPTKVNLNLSSVPEGITVNGAGIYNVGEEVVISTVSYVQATGNVFQHWAIDTLTLPYPIPVIPKPEDYANIVYIDPSQSNGDGTIESPLNDLPNPLAQNTAYLFKRGTTYTGRLSRHFNNCLIGAYGTGEKPVITEGLGLNVNAGVPSNNTVFRELNIQGTSANYAVVGFAQTPRAEYITIAHCNIQGRDDGSGYPTVGCEHGAHHLVFFDNEISFVMQNGFTLNADNVNFIRNYIHDINLSGLTTNGTGDGIQSIYTLQNGYIAGNLIDKSNSRDKYCLMLNLDGHPDVPSENIVVEYNTFVSNSPENGGAAVRWYVGDNSSFRKNKIYSVGLASAFDVIHTTRWNDLAPAGIRDNHIIIEDGRDVGAYNIPTRTQLANNGNQIFATENDRNIYLIENPSIGQYESDIDISTFGAHAFPIFTTDRTHGFTINNNLSLVAVFEFQTRILSLSVEPAGMAQILPGAFNTYNYGTVLQINVRNINPDYQFLHWKRPDGTVYSIHAQALVAMQQDYELIAVLEPIGTPNTFTVDVEIILI